MRPPVYCGVISKSFTETKINLNRINRWEALTRLDLTAAQRAKLEAAALADSARIREIIKGSAQ